MCSDSCSTNPPSSNEASLCMPRLSLGSKWHVMISSVRGFAWGNESELRMGGCGMFVDSM